MAYPVIVIYFQTIISCCWYLLILPPIITPPPHNILLAKFTVWILIKMLSIRYCLDEISHISWGWVWTIEIKHPISCLNFINCLCLSLFYISIIYIYPHNFMTSSSSRSRDVMRSSNYASYLVERPPKAVAKVTACVVCTCRGSFRWKMNGSNRKLYDYEQCSSWS